MANPWFRLYSEFAHDPKVQMLPEHMQRRFIMLMCMRCSNTDETLHETESVTFEDAEVAFVLRISESEVAETKELLKSKGFIDDVWNLLNWNKRQFTSDSSTARVARHRAKKKQDSNADETLQQQKSNALDTEQNRTDISPSLRSGDRRASRLPADWTLPDEWRDWARQERPDLDPKMTAEKFADYWHAKPGQAGRKLDWHATWRNWVREEKATRPASGQRQPGAKYAGAAAAIFDGATHV